METIEKVVEKTEEILGRIGIEATVESGSYPEIAPQYVNIVTNDARLLVGAGAQYLLAVEYIVRRLIEKESSDYPKFFFDVNGYRLRQIEELKQEAKQVAKKVRLYRKELVLKPMSSFERRIIHMALAEYPDITTESIGEDERRRVVIKPYP